MYGDALQSAGPRTKKVCYDAAGRHDESWLLSRALGTCSELLALLRSKCVDSDIADNLATFATQI